MQSACNPLYYKVDAGVFEHFSVLPNFPFDPHFLTSLEPGTKIVKLGSRSGLTEGRLLSVKESVTFYEKKVKHIVSNCVSVAWQSDVRFTAPGDSGSIYYAVRGCFRYPIAVHRATVVVKNKSEDFMEIENGKFERLDIHARFSIGTPLAWSLEQYSEYFNQRGSELGLVEEEGEEQEDQCTVPAWFHRFAV